MNMNYYSIFWQVTPLRLFAYKFIGENACKQPNTFVGGSETIFEFVGLKKVKNRVSWSYSKVGKCCMRPKSFIYPIVYTRGVGTKGTVSCVMNDATWMLVQNIIKVKISRKPSYKEEKGKLCKTVKGNLHQLFFFLFLFFSLKRIIY